MSNIPDTRDTSVDLSGRTALVTGGASGLGRAIAERLSASGAAVGIVDIDGDAAAKASEALPGRSSSAQADVADRVSVRAAVENLEKDLGPIDTLVNSAGIARLAPAEEVEDADWDTTIRVNLTGTFVMCQEVGRGMLERGFGKIINLASQASEVALPDHMAYCASKGAITALTRSLALEWGPRGVCTNTISPTVVLTPLGRDVWDNPKGDVHKAEIPVGRFGEPDEIAAIAAFLASRSANLINGVNLLADGGFTIR